MVRLGLVLAIIIVAICPPVQAAPAKPPRGAGSVYLFTGWVIPFFDSTRGTGTEEIAKTIEARGIKAELNNPADWEKAADAYTQSYDPAAPVAVVGYSFGANAALLFCERLQQSGIPVETLVLIEAGKPVPIPANVRHVVHYYVSGMSDPIHPGTGFSGYLRNINVAEIDPEAARLNHWTLSHFQKLHAAVINVILDGNHLRVWTEKGLPASGAGVKGPKVALGQDAIRN